ncbi:Intraflagellar transport protein 25 [Amphibalanus amphitrite]|uniref:Intraflagellar transport protein 25 n=1 Tax=Amphibalanus amphitrite TaxID=1232801 RepID=A0A6A4X1F0_AMPAM|nr:Intraflagellar transport protein 25 [Amphibalanus amphitrite]
MGDLGLSASGTSIVQASSFDARYPPKCIVDGRMDTFWMTTGLYPQQFVLKLPGLHALDKISIQTYNAFQHQAGKLQTETVSPQDVTANYLRFRILTGHAPFVSVHRMSISGRETRTPIAMDRPPSGEQGTRVIRTAPRPPSAAATPGPLAPPSADRARSVSPAALSLAPPTADFPGPDSEEEGRAASAAPSLFQGLQFDFEGLPSEAGAAKVPDPAEEGERGGQEEGQRGRQEEGEEDGEEEPWK